MKIIETSYYAPDKEVTLETAITNSMAPMYMDYDDQIDRLKDRLDAQHDFVVRLAVALVNSGHVKASDILNSQFGVEE